MREYSLDTLMNLMNTYPDNIMSIKHRYLSLLSQLTVVSFLETDLFIHNVKKISTMGNIFILYLSTPDREDFDILASGTILIEPKIIRGGKNVGHIEDIVVAEHVRNNGLSQVILNSLKQYAKQNDCYKITLDCTDEVKQVYVKNGFEQTGVQMVIRKG